MMLVFLTSGHVNDMTCYPSSLALTSSAGNEFIQTNTKYTEFTAQKKCCNQKASSKVL